MERACLLCAKGDLDGAMAALERLRDLMHQVKEEDEDRPPLTFLRLMPGQDPSKEWVYGLGLLKDPRLKHLEERKEYQALHGLCALVITAVILSACNEEMEKKLTGEPTLEITVSD